MADVLMPRLSDSMDEGTILRWLKRTGEEVRRGDGLAEIETDKATLTYEAEAEGVLEVVAAEGETLPVGAVIARLAPAPARGANGAPQASSPSPAAAAAAAAAANPTLSASPTPDAPAPPPPVEPPAPERIMASPLARRIAREQGIQLTGVAGTGPGGRIVSTDVEAAGAQPEAAPEPAAVAPEPAPVAPEPAAAPEPEPAPEPVASAPAPAAGTAKGDVTRQELTRAQQVVARRMAESKATIPDFTLTAEIDMQRCVRLRKAMKDLDADVVPSLGDMVVKACALALREFPRANGAYRDGGFELYSRVNVGIAIAAQDSLAVPTIFDADQKALRDIAREARKLTERVREGSATPPELSGGTFTVFDLGMHGVTEFGAVINPPQAAILAVGAVERRPVVHKGKVRPRYRMNASLTCDHRILYGAEAAAFLARVRALLEQPAAAFLL